MHFSLSKKDNASNYYSIFPYFKFMELNNISQKKNSIFFYFMSIYHISVNLNLN